jgi:hypothetical protein
VTLALLDEYTGLTLGRQCSYNEAYSTLKIEWHGVVITLEDLA